MLKRIPVLLTLTMLVGAPLAAQNAPEDVRDELLMQFNNSARKMVRLAEAMPADLYQWSPGEGVMSVARVYAHIARYNFMYPEDALGAELPHGINLRTMEDLTDKDQIVLVLRQSVEFARAVMQDMTAADNNRRAEIRRLNMGFVYQAHHLLPEFTAVENVPTLTAIDGVFTLTATKSVIILIAFDNIITLGTSDTIFAFKTLDGICSIGGLSTHNSCRNYIERNYIVSRGP